MKSTKMIFLKSVLPVIFVVFLNSVASFSNNTTDGITIDFNASLPSNYEYYTAGGIKYGLDANSPKFYLNSKEIWIYSGSFHYFRVPRAYWRDRLRKMRAAGLNTVATYIPWNLHEPRSGVFDWGNGNNDMSDFLHLEEFIKLAKEEDLFVIIRTGPFICAEFEFGGFPSWLLRDNKLEVRTSKEPYMTYVKRYFAQLLPKLVPLQFQKGGPIIMFQVENEYSISGKHDLTYMKELGQIMWNSGIKELLITADNPTHKTYGTLPDLFLMTGNFNNDVKNNLDILKTIQPKKPRMTMEFWGGWYDHWGDKHTTNTLQYFTSTYEEILKYPSSVNVYMFVGSTNFGFLNGAENHKYDNEDSDYHAIVSSYDYLSPISESGDYTDRYWAVKKLLEQHNPIKTRLPASPALSEKVAYNTITIEKQIYLYNLLEKLSPVNSSNVMAMEKLPINGNSGQSYGYIVYRKTGLDLKAHSTLEIEGRVCDTFMILVNNVLITPWVENARDLTSAATSFNKNPKFVLTNIDLKGASLEILVENWGRVNVGVYKQLKGIWQGGVKLNGAYLHDWTIFPLEFKKSWTNSLITWQNYDPKAVGPVLYRATLNVNGTPKDTFVNMESWGRGIVIVNGFVLGRYARMGPVQTLFLPAPLLKSGANRIYVFEHYQSSKQINFSKNHIYINH